MFTPDDWTLTLKTPCCQRSFKVPFMLHATDIRRRTCPACKAKWSVEIHPLGEVKVGGIEGGGFAHKLEWTKL